MQLRSATGVSGSTGSVRLATGTDSPVRTDSSTIRAIVVSKRRSAGTRMPDSRRTMSPGTSSALSTICSTPSRSTRALGERYRMSERMADSARHSWTKPKRALIAKDATMTLASTHSPSAPATTAASPSATMSGLANWCTRISSGFGGGTSARRLGPKCARRRRASAEESPCGVVASARSVSSGESAYQGRSSWSSALGWSIPPASIGLTHR